MVQRLWLCSSVSHLTEMAIMLARCHPGCNQRICGGAASQRIVMVPLFHYFIIACRLRDVPSLGCLSAAFEHLGRVAAAGRSNRLLLSRLVGVVKHFALWNDSIGLVVVVLRVVLLLLLTPNAMELRWLELLVHELVLLLICNCTCCVLRRSSDYFATFKFKKLLITLQLLILMRMRMRLVVFHF